VVGHSGTGRVGGTPSDRTGPLVARWRDAVTTLASLPSDTVIRAMGLTIPPTGWIRTDLAVVRTRTSSFYLLRRGDAVAAFDSGWGASVVRREVASLSLEPGSVTHVFLSHSDLDHVAGSRVFVNAEVFLARAELPLATGRVSRALGIRNHVPRHDLTLLEDGDDVELGTSRVRALLVPGHTPGSMCFLVDGRMLFTGDALTIKHGEVFTPRRLWNMDIAGRLRSNAVISDVNAPEIFTGHSGFFLSGLANPGRAASPE